MLLGLPTLVDVKRIKIIFISVKKETKCWSRSFKRWHRYCKWHNHLRGNRWN